MGVKIVGADDLAKFLENKADRLSKESIQSALRKSGSNLEEKATHLVPVDTSNLKKSIKGQLKGMSYVVDANADYAGYVESGTRYMKAQPYMRPAYESAKSKFKDEIERLIK